MLLPCGFTSIFTAYCRGLVGSADAASEPTVDLYKREQERRKAELRSVVLTEDSKNARDKFETSASRPEPPPPKPISSRSPEAPPVAEVIAARQKAALAYEEEQAEAHRLRAEEAFAANEEKVRAQREAREDAREKRERQEGRKSY